MPAFSAGIWKTRLKQIQKPAKKTPLCTKEYGSWKWALLPKGKYIVSSSFFRGQLLVEGSVERHWLRTFYPLQKWHVHVHYFLLEMALFRGHVRFPGENRLCRKNPIFMSTTRVWIRRFIRDTNANCWGLDHCVLDPNVCIREWWPTLWLLEGVGHVKEELAFWKGTPCLLVGGWETYYLESRKESTMCL